MTFSGSRDILDTILITAYEVSRGMAHACRRSNTLRRPEEPAGSGGTGTGNGCGSGDARKRGPKVQGGWPLNLSGKRTEWGTFHAAGCRGGETAFDGGRRKSVPVFFIASKSLFKISTCMDWRVDFLPCKAKIRRHPDGWQGFLTQSGRKIRRQDMRGEILNRL